MTAENLIYSSHFRFGHLRYLDFFSGADMIDETSFLLCSTFGLQLNFKGMKGY